MRLLGAQLAWASNSLRGVSTGAPASLEGQTTGTQDERVKAIGAIVVSALFLVIGVIVLLMGTDDLKKAATGWMGVVLGYWVH